MRRLISSAVDVLTATIDFTQWMIDVTRLEHILLHKHWRLIKAINHSNSIIGPLWSNLIGHYQSNQAALVSTSLSVLWPPNTEQKTVWEQQYEATAE